MRARKLSQLLLMLMIASRGHAAEGGSHTCQLPKTVIAWLDRLQPLIKEHSAGADSEAYIEGLWLKVHESLSMMAGEFLSPEDESEARQAFAQQIETIQKDKNLRPKRAMTDAQREVVELYLNHFGDAIEGENWDPDAEHLWMSDLDVEAISKGPGENKYQQDLEQYGVIQLRPLVTSERPRLIIGCGDRRKTEAPFPSNPHLKEDTIDPWLPRNPSIVGWFGRNVVASDGTKAYCLPSNHYQVVWDEAYLQLDENLWTEIERVLKPGGFFLANFYPWLHHTPPPAGSRLRLHSMISFAASEEGMMCGSLKGQVRASVNSPDIAEEFWGDGEPWWAQVLGKTHAYVLIAKPFADGALPKRFDETDMPSGLKLVEQVRI